MKLNLPRMLVTGSILWLLLRGSARLDHPNLVDAVALATCWTCCFHFGVKAWNKFQRMR
jgi:hypothetical protein